jgi:hypothetical protein
MATGTFERQSNMLNERVNALFKGNIPETTTIDLRSHHASAESLRARVELSIGWKSTGESLIGALTPDKSIWCSTSLDFHGK